jgi:hypothetical protein
MQSLDLFGTTIFLMSVDLKLRSSHYPESTVSSTLPVKATGSRLIPTHSSSFLSAKSKHMKTYTVKVTNISTEWFLKGKLHREDGPAIEYANGTKYWYINGKRHREDGPAIEYVGGTRVWYLNGEELTEEEFNRRMNPVKELTVAEIEKLLGYSVKVVSPTTVTAPTRSYANKNVRVSYSFYGTIEEAREYVAKQKAMNPKFRYRLRTRGHRHGVNRYRQYLPIAKATHAVVYNYR